MGLLMMSEKERLCKSLMEMVAQGRLKLVAAAIQLGCSYRHINRLYKRYKAERDAGLVHKARGRTSNRRNPHRKEIIKRYRERYEGFGPTLAAEKLKEEQYAVDHETLRRWLIAEELWSKQYNRSPFRKKRERRLQFGELVQMDGSIHEWLEEGCFTCLMNMVDDATSKTLARLESGETTAAVFRIVWDWIERYGIPLALYVDLKNVYISPQNISHFERACMKLGIRIIKAYSPQAKGRVERNHAIYQDRFVKELHLKNIKTIKEANILLKNGFIDNLNKKFEKPAQNPESACRPLNGVDLNQVFCWEYRRQVQHDWTFSFKGQCYQIKKSYGSVVRPKEDIFVRKHLDGAVSAWYKNEKLIIIALGAKSEAIKVVENIVNINKGKKPTKPKSRWGSTNGDFFRVPNNRSAILPKAYRTSKRFSNKITGS